MSDLSADVAADLSQELAVALRLARGAAGILDRHYQTLSRIDWKEPGDPVTEADREANAYLVRELARAFPGDAILAEESSDDLARLARRRVWMVDPIDGTTEFIAGNGEFCVMLGLVQDGRPVLGVVYRPVGDAMYWAAGDQGAFVERSGSTSRLQVSSAAALPDLKAVVSRSHRTPRIDEIHRRLGVQHGQSLGSLGLKSAAIACGEGDFYIQPSAGPKEWDTCAPEAIVRAAGGIMTDCWDRPLPYNQADVRRPFGVLASNGACRAQLAPAVSRVLREMGLSPESGF